MGVEELHTDSSGSSFTMKEEKERLSSSAGDPGREKDSVSLQLV